MNTRTRKPSERGGVLGHLIAYGSECYTEYILDNKDTIVDKRDQHKRNLKLRVGYCACASCHGVRRFAVCVALQAAWSQHFVGQFSTQLGLQCWWNSAQPSVV